MPWYVNQLAKATRLVGVLEVVVQVASCQRRAQVRQRLLLVLVCARAQRVSHPHCANTRRREARASQREPARATKLHLPQTLHTAQRPLVRVRRRVALAKATVNEAAGFAMLRKEGA